MPSKPTLVDPLLLRPVKHKPYSKLTPKEHIGRELELWGIITGLELRLKDAKKKIRELKKAQRNRP